ncbi:hypothetical protein GCM10027052_10570 [Parafrigoribacterium mesophilum]|uniref:hypothetical protein n=1 Tax=Parafrigoribacterium mesophilum TaxID=433646 RepID=UPI0031FBE09B
MIPSFLRWDDAPGAERQAIGEIDRWASSEAMAGLVGVFGGVPVGSGAELLGWLDQFSAQHWDFRAGAERNLGQAPQFSLAEESETERACLALGLASDDPPRRSSYDTVLMTGGMVRAGIVKPRFVRELLRGGLDAASIVFVGAFRPFGGDEAETAVKLGVPGSDEVDAMVAGMDAAFGPLGEPEVVESIAENPFLSWRRLAWQLGKTTLRVVAAPSSHPQRRANTADTFRFWAEHHSVREQSVLVVTTPIYVPYQGAVAVDVLGLGHGLTVETVAVSATASDLGELSQEFRTEHKLQELRSAIRAIGSLRERLGYLDWPGV